MKRSFVFVLFCVGIFVRSAHAGVVTPQSVLQGDTVRVTMDEAAKPGDIVSAVFEGKTVPVFSYEGTVTALIGIALDQKPGSYGFAYTLSDGDMVGKLIRVQSRERPQEQLGIPQKLGGNTLQAQRSVINYLASENDIIAKLQSGSKAFWSLPFEYPVKDPHITDSYGFERQTGPYVIAHKGTDFRAPIGTRVLAMNRGIVRLARNFKIYGNIVVIDHGLGVMSLYLHLSKIQVNVGELVKQGQEIGLSGETGYAEGPHLHVSVHVGKISIDPIQFLHLFGT